MLYDGLSRSGRFYSSTMDRQEAVQRRIVRPAYVQPAIFRRSVQRILVDDGGIPWPVSDTTISSVPSEVGTANTSTEPLAGVWATALSSRLLNTWTSRPASPRTTGSEAGARRRTVIYRVSARGITCATASARIGPRSTGSLASLRGGSGPLHPTPTAGRQRHRPFAPAGAWPGRQEPGSGPGFASGRPA